MFKSWKRGHGSSGQRFGRFGWGQWSVCQSRCLGQFGVVTRVVTRVQRSAITPFSKLISAGFRAFYMRSDSGTQLPTDFLHFM